MYRPIRNILLFLMTGALFGCAGQNDPHPRFHGPSEPPEITDADYRMFDAQGEPVSWEAVKAVLLAVEVVLVGETHGDPVAHYLEAELFKKLHEWEPDRPLALSLEMFEADVQIVLDEYLDDLITERHLLSAGRPWSNYRTDYRPMVEYAKAEGLPVVAANAPGRYVNRVSRLGAEALGDLSDTAKGWLPPLPCPPPSETFRAKFFEFWQGMGAAHGTPAEGEETPELSEEEIQERKGRFERFLAAQALWDAAMAHSIAGALADRPGTRVMHVNGKFHSAEGLGVPEYLDRYTPGTPMATVTILPDEAFSRFSPEYTGFGDIIILTNAKLRPSAPAMSLSSHRPALDGADAMSER